MNLAPFSFFNAFGADPPIVVFAPNRRSDGSKKDTLANVEATGEFVVNAAVAELAEAVNLTPRTCRTARAKLNSPACPCALVKVSPRLAESPVHMECVLRQVMPIGDRPVAANLVIGEVVLFHIDDACSTPTAASTPQDQNDRPPRRQLLLPTPTCSRWSGPDGNWSLARRPAAHDSLSCIVSFLCDANPSRS